jgi:hypothetical protein
MADLATTSPSSPPAPAWTFNRRTIRGLLLAWVGAFVVAHLLRQGVTPPRLSLGYLATVAESVALLLIIGALLAFEPVRAWLRGVPRPHLTIIASFFFVAVVGQLTRTSPRTFPFPAWTMYGRPDTPTHLQFYRYHGVDRAGQQVEVDPAKLFTFVNVAEIASRVRQFARPVDSTREPAREEARGKIRDWLLAIGRAYNREHPDAPLTSLEFVRYDWEFRRGTPASEVSPESLLKVDLPEGAAP